MYGGCILLDHGLLCKPRAKNMALINSCLIAHDTWRQMSARLNKGHTQFNSCPRLFKPAFDRGLLKNLP